LQSGIRLLLLFLFTRQLVSCSGKYDHGLLKILSFFQSLVLMPLEAQLGNWNCYQLQLWMDGWLVLVLRSLPTLML